MEISEITPDPTKTLAPVIRLTPKRPGPDVNTGTVEAALQFIQEFYDEVKSGKADVADGFCIHWLSSDPIKETVRHHHWSWQLSASEQVGLLTIGINEVLRDARGE